ncbi:hypothetical protein [Marisediminitalea sp.]|uniref:hypothetical protein n=1 Tax=Marisediminitalea sp. TaxID=2662268 RepID=UPI003514479B
MDLTNLKAQLKDDLGSRRYMLMTIDGDRKVACHVNGEWIIDNTCKTINEMLEAGLVSEAAISGWISNQCFTSH